MLWILIIPFMHMYKAHDVIQLNRVTEAAPGDTVTLDCFFPEAFKTDPLSWYKQTLGQKPFLVARSSRATISWSPLFSEDFQNGRMNIQRSDGVFYLTITNVTSSDEATYYCTLTMQLDHTFGNGTFLALKGHRQFNLSFKDDRAFICAVANCGKMNTEKKTVLNTEKAVVPVVYGLAAVLGLCFVLICYLVSVIYHYRKHKHDKEVKSQQVHTDRSSRDPSSGQDAEELVNYAALHFSDKKLKRGKKKRDLPQESIYSDVRG
ncbi:uncharacterized protein LOC116220699 isoform X2 [Clupea harengus]|uniref:Uncharacterized protein LOC116220699 isoform X2 n=1 Tax=Clupea harengus TaxID=7950 RepID=A0A6P8FLP2_CLUHA|nr:uncharacterized protein LOC116220699 isoform X2 [Clupea harengus]